MPSSISETLNTVNLPEVIVANALGAFLVLLILVSKRRRRGNIMLDGKLFDAMCYLTLFLCTLETFSFWVDGKMFVGARQLIIFSNAALFALQAVFCCVWICYLDYKMLEDRQRLKKYFGVFALPAAVVCVLSAATLFADVLFTVDENNMYARLPLALGMYAVAFYYLTYGIVLAFHYRKRVEKYLFLPVLLFLLPIYVCSLIQMFCYGISLIWASVALGLTSLFINLQNEESYLDKLTNLYNRNYLMDYLFHAENRAKQGVRMEGMMIDINAFKTINDTYGHAEGDRVLQAIGRVLLHTRDKDVVVARYGGDEFVILFEDKPEGEALRAIERIQKGLEEVNRAGEFSFPLSISAGTAVFKSGGVDEFLRAMDRSMYREKSAFYRRRENDRRGEGRGEGRRASDRRETPID